MPLNAQEAPKIKLFSAADMGTPQGLIASGQAKKLIPFIRNDTVAVARKGMGITCQNLQNFMRAASLASIGISDPATQPCGANAVKAFRPYGMALLNEKPTTCTLAAYLQSQVARHILEKYGFQ